MLLAAYVASIYALSFVRAEVTAYIEYLRVRIRQNHSVASLHGCVARERWSLDAFLPHDSSSSANGMCCSSEYDFLLLLLSHYRELARPGSDS